MQETGQAGEVAGLRGRPTLFGCQHLLAEAVPLAFITLLWAGLFWKALACRGVFFHYDHALQNFPYRQFFAEGLREGHFRLWTHDLFCGFPLFAESQGNAAYPPFILLFMLLPAWIAYNYYTALHFLLAGVGAYWLARTMRISRGGSTITALTYMFAGPILFHAHHTNIVVGVSWLPVLLALLEWIARRVTAPRLVAFSCAAALLALGAQPQYTLYNALVCGMFVAWRLWIMVGVEPRRLLHIAGGLALAGTLAFLLASVQILPLVELIGQTSRSGAGMGLGRAPTAPANLITVFMPRYFGAPGLGTYWGHSAPGAHTEVTMFCGVLPLFLAFVGLTRDRRRTTLFFFGLGAFAFLFSLGVGSIPYRFFGRLPLFRGTRLPERFAYVAALCVGILAGKGLDVLRQCRDRSAVRRSVLTSVILVGGAGAVCLLLAFLYTYGLRRLSYSELSIALGDIVEERVSIMWQYLRQTLPSEFLRLTGALAAGTALLALGFQWILRGRMLAVAWSILIFVELAQAGYDFLPVTSPELYREPPPLARLLGELTADEPGRIHATHLSLYWSPYDPAPAYPETQGWAVQPGTYVRCLDRVPSNSNMLWGLPSAGGFCPLQTVRFKELLGRSSHLSTTIDFHLPPTLDLLGVRYVLVPTAAPRPPHTPYPDLPRLQEYEKVSTVGAVRVFKNTSALPMAFIVHNAEPAGDNAAERLNEEHFPYADTVLIDGDQGLLTSSRGRQDAQEIVEWLDSPDGVLRLRAKLTRPGYLVVSEQNYPGWKASVDGHPAEILQADHLLMALPLRTGQHDVHIRFAPDSVRWGVTLSLIGLLLCAIWLVVARWLPQESGGKGDEPTEKEIHLKAFFKVAAIAAFVFAAGVAAAPRIPNLGPYWTAPLRQLDPANYGLWHTANRNDLHP